MRGKKRCLQSIKECLQNLNTNLGVFNIIRYVDNVIIILKQVIFSAKCKRIQQKLIEEEKINEIILCNRQSSTSAF